MYTVMICCNAYYNVIAVFVNKQLAIDYAYYYGRFQKYNWLEELDGKYVKVIDGEKTILKIPY